ncbi:MAG: hypothetical protein E7082_05095 [Bacteroidales bacterium]|nr:hypothetical protein [Bacteroidales bacterium]
MKLSRDKQENDNLLSRLLQGRLVSGDFFARYWLQIFLVLAMVLVYITNRYSCQRSMEQINRLNNRLEVVRTESIRIRGEYMGRIRESAMQRSVQEAGLDLAVQSQPPYRIED